MPIALPPTVASPTPSFPDLLSLVFKTRDTREHALELGANEAALIRYADGAVCVSERQFLEGIIARNRWSLEFVANYVKQKRRRAQHKDAA